MMKNLLNTILVLCAWACTERIQAREIGKVDFHTIQHSTLFPSSSSCGVPSPQESMKNSSLYVVHRYGPCWSLATASPTHDDILREDEARVNSIHSKLSKNFNPSQSTDLPAKSGISLGTGNYIVTIGIGTPKHDQSVIFDTGSDLSWIQCQPCGGDHSCYPQSEPIFNPSSSSSYSTASCTSPACASLKNRDIPRCSASSTCNYDLHYGDNSTTVGDLAKENFTLTNSVFFNGVYFGCGNNNHGLFGESAGLLGLGRGSLSFPSQTAAKYNKIFSYCLPFSPSSIGHLTFGSAGNSNSVKFTPIPSSSSSSFYGLDIIGITVGGMKLAIPPVVFSDSKAIIDSGTVITRLPPKAYAVMRDAFKKQMSNYKIIPGRSEFLDTCYDFTGVETISIPKISFTFGGGSVVDLNFGGILVPIAKSQACLAFAANSNDEEIAIYGNAQQKTFQIVYDGPGKRVGFAPNGCT